MTVGRCTRPCASSAYEGVVAKKLDGRYRPGERGWIKLKNSEYWRRDLEIGAMQRSGERKQRFAAPR